MNHFFFAHLALAALDAMSLRFLAERLSARALPPFNPPFLPISARYWLIGERSSSGSSVESRTISAANSFGSLGSFLERIMHRSMGASFAESKSQPAFQEGS